MVAGANNAGKSSILHALALWEYCKILHYFEHGENYFTNNRSVGINTNDFTPINLPSLKYLWKNLSIGTTYNLKIKLFWDIEAVEYFLGFALAYAQERVYIKVDSHNLNSSETKIPKVAYLPPFAGIKDKETWFSKADRKKLIGQGLAGSVLRNLIIDLHTESQAIREKLLGDRTRLSDNDGNILNSTTTLKY